MKIIECNSVTELFSKVDEIQEKERTVGLKEDYKIVGNIPEKEWFECLMTTIYSSILDGKLEQELKMSVKDSDNILRFDFTNNNRSVVFDRKINEYFRITMIHIN